MISYFGFPKHHVINIRGAQRSRLGKEANTTAKHLLSPLLQFTDHVLRVKF